MLKKVLIISLKVLLKFIELGPKEFTRKAIAKIGRKTAMPLSGQKSLIDDLSNKYGENPFGQPFNSEKKMKSLNWVIPSFEIGSGGHLNIFRFIAGLEKRGFKCSITIVEPCNIATSELARQTILDNFIELEADVIIGQDQMKPAWCTIATSWQTAYVVRNFQSTALKCYFVQDFEPYFYPRGSDYYLAEDTYRFGLVGITAGTWLSTILAKTFGMKTYPFSFSYDKDLYYHLEKPMPPDKIRVFFYARPPTPRRMFEIGLMALNEVAKWNPEIEFILAGWDIHSYDIPFRHTTLGVLAIDDLPEVYRSCSVALVLSATNASLLPLEIMACGCPVVTNSGEHVNWLLDKSVAHFCEPNCNSLAAGLIEVLNDSGLRQNLVTNALQFAEKTSWNEEVSKVADVLEQFFLEKS